MGAQVDIVFASPLWELADGAEKAILRAIDAAQGAVACRPASAEICVLLCDDAEIRRLNRQWRNKDSATNVLSFPTPPGPAAAEQLGDIAIAYETVAREASDEGKSFADHLSHLVVHGYLHLVGHDHETDEEAEEMERREREILSGLGVSDPYSIHSSTNQPAR